MTRLTATPPCYPAKLRPRNLIVLLPGLRLRWIKRQIITMLCDFCSNIDLDQLIEKQGYKHHASCADLLQSARNGCELCKLIWDTQWTDIGGNLQVAGHDWGALDTQITAREVVGRKPGKYCRIRYGQEARSMQDYQLGADGSLASNPPYLWSFLKIWILEAEGVGFSRAYPFAAHFTVVAITTCLELPLR